MTKITKHKNRDKSEQNIVNEERMTPDKKVDRRSLIATMGLTGAAVMSGGLLNSFDRKVFADDTNGEKEGSIPYDADQIPYKYSKDLIERTVGGKLREFISVKDFGVRGDGKTDDTVLIQAAIDHAESSGRREVFFPEGTYKVGTNNEENDISSASIKKEVEKFEEEGIIKDVSVSHALKLHLITMDHSEQKKEAKKVFAQAKSLKQLLDHHNENGALPNKAYDTLKVQANSLLKKWESYDEEKDQGPLNVPDSILLVGDRVNFTAGSYKVVSLAEMHDQLGELFEDKEHVHEQLKGIAISVKDFGAKGDGKTDDTQAFQAAMENSRSVVIPEGHTFLVNDLEIKSDVSVWGSGKLLKSSSAESAFHITGKNIIIEGVQFESTDDKGQPSTEIKLGDGSENIRITNCTFTGSVYSAISGAVDTTFEGTYYDKPVNGTIITNCVFDGYKRPAYLHSVNNITIATNIFKNCDFDAIRLRENDGHCIINANQFYNIGDPSWPDDQTRDAIDTFWAGKDLIITNNVINRTARLGFDLKGAPRDREIADITNSSSRVIVANNHIEGCRDNGILIAGQSKMTDSDDFINVYSYIVTGNTIQYCNQKNFKDDGSAGIANGGIQIKRIAKYINISNNMFISNYGRGIYIWNSNHKDSYKNDKENSGVRSVQVTGNTVVNNGHKNNLTGSNGMTLKGVSHAIVSNNIVDNDEELPNANAQYVGIFIGDGQGYVADRNVILRDNIATNNLGHQIYVEKDSKAVAVLDGNVEEGPNAYQSSGRSSKEIKHASDVSVITNAPHAIDNVERRTLSNTGSSGNMIEAINYIHVDDLENYTDILELGYRSSYIITVASVESRTGLVGRVIFEIAASISKNRIASNIREILNDNNGADIQFKTDSPRIEDEGSRTLQIKPRYPRTNKFTVHVKSYCRYVEDGEFVFK